MLHLIDKTHIIVYIENHPPFLVTIEDTDTPITDICNTCIPPIHDLVLTEVSTATDTTYLLPRCTTDTSGSYACVSFPKVADSKSILTTLCILANAIAEEKVIRRTALLTITEL